MHTSRSGRDLLLSLPAFPRSSGLLLHQVANILRPEAADTQSNIALNRLLPLTNTRYISCQTKELGYGWRQVLFSMSNLLVKFRAAVFSRTVKIDQVESNLCFSSNFGHVLPHPLLFVVHLKTGKDDTIRHQNPEGHPIPPATPTKAQRGSSSDGCFRSSTN